MKKDVFLRKSSITHVIGIPGREETIEKFSLFKKRKETIYRKPKIYIYHKEDSSKPYWFELDTEEEYLEMLKRIMDSLENKEGLFVKIGIV